MRLQKDITSNNNLLHITDLFMQYRYVALRGLFIVFFIQTEIWNREAEHIQRPLHLSPARVKDQ